VVDVAAWCGRCGESFATVEVVEPAGDVAVGSCPRCGRPFAPSYTTVLVTAVRRLLAAADALEEAAGQLRDVAPALHVDARTLTGPVEETLGHGRRRG
jgi:hypothetical protein